MGLPPASGQPLLTDSTYIAGLCRNQSLKTSQCRHFMSNQLKPLGDILGPRIGALEQKAKAQITLTEKVREILPEPEKNHVVAAAYRIEPEGGNTLVVMTDSSVWCPRLRYAEEALRAGLVAGGIQDFARLKVRVVGVTP